MEYTKRRTNIVDHPRFLKAGIHGRDLWNWGMDYSGLHETDGELPREAVLATTYGKGGKKNAEVAAHLVSVGLWEETPNGWRALKWTEMGNLTKAELEEKRAAARERMKGVRKRTSGDEAKPNTGGGVRANIERTSRDVRTSPSPCISDLGERVQGEGAEPSLTEVIEKPDIHPLDREIPPAWRERAEGIARSACIQHDTLGAWRRYNAWCVEYGHEPNEARWARWVEENVGETAAGNARRDDTNWGKLRSISGGRTGLPADAAPFHAPARGIPDAPDYDRETAVSAAAALAAGNFGPATRKAAGGGS